MQIVEQSNTKEFFSFLKNSHQCNKIYLDIETSGLDPYANKVYTIQIMFDDTEEIYVFNMLKYNNIDYILGLIRKKLIIGHNIGFDIKTIKYHYNISLENVYCTQVNHVIINQGVLLSQYPSLEELVLEYCDVALNKDVREEFYKQGILTNITQEQFIYGAEDVKYLKCIYNKQQELLEKSKQLTASSIENLLTPVLADMEINGIILDSERWLKLAGTATEDAEKMYKDLKSTYVDTALEKQEFANAYELIKYLGVSEIKTKRDIKLYESVTEPSQMRALAVTVVNPASVRQTFVFINEILGIKVKDTNVKTLEKIIGKSPIIRQIIEFREFAIASSTFGEEYLTNINPVTGKIHTNFNQVGTATGRLSSSKPNIQNIKKESEYRNAFVADKGYVFVCADYSQQELRVLASICRDEKLIEIFIKDLDAHQATAAYLFNKTYEEVTKVERGIGKSLNFGVIYGISPFGLFNNWGIALEEGKRYLDDFYNKVYVQYSAFKDKVGEIIYKLGYSSTMDGRKRFYNKKTLYIDSKDMIIEKESIIRKGMNHMIQGTSADITKLAMCDIYYKNPFGEDLKLLLQVHDEVIVLAKKERAQEILEFVKECLINQEERILRGIVPAKIDIKIADNWVH